MECSAIPSRVIASCFAITGFVAALVIGFAAGLAVDDILLRAIMVMLICWPVGRLLGWFAQRAVEENIAHYKRAHPIPEDAMHAPSGIGMHAEVELDDVQVGGSAEDAHVSGRSA